MLKKRILLADDEAVVRAVLVRTLEAEGYEVITADNGWEAWRQIQNQPVDLLITDHVMPMMSGVKLVNRARGIYPALPVILVSGFFTRGDTPTEYPEDVVMLAKPFTSDLVLDAIRRLLP